MYNLSKNAQGYILSSSHFPTQWCQSEVTPSFSLHTPLLYPCHPSSSFVAGQRLGACLCDVSLAWLASVDRRIPLDSFMVYQKTLETEQRRRFFGNEFYQSMAKPISQSVLHQGFCERKVRWCSSGCKPGLHSFGTLFFNQIRRDRMSLETWTINYGFPGRGAPGWV